MGSRFILDAEVGSRFILGVDPGIKGGLAVLDFRSSIVKLINAIDIPTVGTAAKERVDAIALVNFLINHKPEHALIERAQAMPRQGASSGFKYGRAVGAIEAVITSLNIPVTFVEPSQWKKYHRLPGLTKDKNSKEYARQRALQIFPAAHAMFARKKDHGRAEAALIALTAFALLPTSSH